MQVCDFGNSAWLPPQGYQGTISFNEESPTPGPGSPWVLLDPATLTWSGFTFGDGTIPQGALQVDSAGRLHNVIPRTTSFDYRISADGGRSWSTVNVALPAGMSIEHWDFRAHKNSGVAGVVVHAQKSGEPALDQDLAYKLDIRTNTPVLKRSYTIGLGDVDSTAGVTNATGSRMDFETVTILPGGRLAISFLDSTAYALHFATGQPRDAPSPNIAIELESYYK